MTRMDNYWMSNRDWWYFDEYGRKVLKDTAPKEAKESYKRYCEQAKRVSECYKKGEHL